MHVRLSCAIGPEMFAKGWHRETIGECAVMDMCRRVRH